MEGRPTDGPYSVVESPEFLAQVAAIVGDVERWDEIKWGGAWLLERDPEMGEYIADDDSWALQYLTNPPIVIFYKIDKTLMRVIPLEAFRL